MLIKKSVLQSIASGDIDLAFRCWKRPTVKQGGTLRTAIGVLVVQDLAAVVFLAGPASSYITGAVIPVDGGFRLG